MLFYLISTICYAIKLSIALSGLTILLFKSFFNAFFFPFLATYSFPSLFLFLALFQKALLLWFAIDVSLLNFIALNFKFTVFLNRRFSNVDFFSFGIFMAIILGRLCTFFCDSIHTSCGVNNFMNMKFQFSKFADHEFDP